MSVSIWWIRRDLRIFDNQQLHAALANSDSIIPLFILDPVLLNGAKVGAKRKDFLFRGLKQLNADLRELGRKLVVRKGSPAEVFYKLFNEHDVSGIYAEEDFSPYAQQRDARIAARYPLELVGYPTVRHPAEVLKKDRSPYKVYTPFMRAWKRMPIESLGKPLPVPTSLGNAIEIKSDPIPDLTEPDSQYIPSGAVGAQERLELFVSGKNAPLFTYDTNRDRVDLDLTSGLSPYLKFGMISARQSILSAYQALEFVSEQTKKSVTTWINQIIWRDFFYSILFHAPQATKGAFNKKFAGIKWIDDPESTQKWKEGQTGYPIVDAAMRQLKETGWIHNRLRMITGSFLVKNLLTNWQVGESWFMQNLIDADLACNNGGWQWVAGTGTDAAPYFRIFNPISQSKRFDPNGDYIRKWVPELTHLSSSNIHNPWENDITVRNYPEPIVDHKYARERTLAIYKAAMSQYQRNGE
jgi:deoxyribodipyrimidine photo-lyase